MEVQTEGELGETGVGDQRPFHQPGTGPAPTSLVISVIGPGSVTIGGEPVRFATRHAELAIYLLALAGADGMGRDELMSALWPGVESRAPVPVCALRCGKYVGRSAIMHGGSNANAVSWYLLSTGSTSTCAQVSQSAEMGFLLVGTSHCPRRWPNVWPETLASSAARGRTRQLSSSLFSYSRRRFIWAANAPMTMKARMAKMNVSSMGTPGSMD